MSTAGQTLAARPPSPAPSISLLEIKADTRLVLGAFLRRSLSTPQGQRPGWVGGAYRDRNKFSASAKDGRPKSDGSKYGSFLPVASKDGCSKSDGSKDVRSKSDGSKDGRSKSDGSKDGRSKSEASKDGRSISEPSRNGNTLPEASKDGRCKTEGDGNSLDSQSSSEGEKKLKFKDLLKKHLKARSFKLQLQDSQKTDGRLQEDVVSPYSSPNDDGSDGEEENKKKKKKKKKKSPFSSLMRKMKSKKDRPNSLVISDRKADPAETPGSPVHTPEFYDEVAESMDRFAMQHNISPEIQQPSPASPANDKEAVVQQLVQILQAHGDAINDRIQSSPFLRTSLANMSYGSFANLVDRFTSQTRPPAPAPASPTLSRIAMTMEVSRRVVTATGTQRIQGHAERYMEKFTPWVKSHGGWENIIQEEVPEYD